MPDFKFLPTLKKCCGCIDLKIGSIIIAVLAMLDYSDFYLSEHYSLCKHPSHLVAVLQPIIHWLSFVTNIALFFTAIGFIYGVIKGINKTANWFMYAIIFLLVVRILYIIVHIILGIALPGCTVFNYQLYIKIVGILVWLYFLTVIKSYKQEM